jgi:hypothetical protein
MLHVLAFLITLPAAAQPIERPDKEPYHPTCNQGQVEACRQKYADAINLVQSWLRDLEPRLQTAYDHAAFVDKSLSSMKIESSSIAAEKKMLSRELGFLRGKPPAKTTEVFSGRLSLEDFFHMHPLHRDWRERYPAERGEKLSALLNEATKKESDINARVALVDAEKAKATSEYQSALSQKNSWLGDTWKYEGMRNGGCQDDICP